MACSTSARTSVPRVWSLASLYIHVLYECIEQTRPNLLRTGDRVVSFCVCSLNKSNAILMFNTIVIFLNYDFANDKKQFSNPVNGKLYLNVLVVKRTFYNH